MHSSIENRRIVSLAKDRALLYEHLSQNIGGNVYQIGDLEEPFWSNTMWYGYFDGSELRSIIMRYMDVNLPVYLILDNGIDIDTLSAFLMHMPDRAYLHVNPAYADVVSECYRTVSHGRHKKMYLQNQESFPQHGNVSPLLDSDEALSFYKEAYPGSFFNPAMLETGCYVGIREHGIIVAAGGVHVISKRFRTAAIGNIAVHQSSRGRGYGRIIMEAVITRLREKGIRHIGLNVAEVNTPARKIYENLGFAYVREYLELDCYR